MKPLLTCYSISLRLSTILYLCYILPCIACEPASLTHVNLFEPYQYDSAELTFLQFVVLELNEMMAAAKIQHVAVLFCKLCLKGPGPTLTLLLALH